MVKLVWHEENKLLIEIILYENLALKNVERIHVINNYSKVYDMFYSMFNKCVFTNYHIYCYFRLNVIWLWWHMNHILPRKGCRFVNTKSLRLPDVRCILLKKIFKMYFINILGRTIKQAMVPPLSLLDKPIIKSIK